jgi:hypothetical protein
MTDDGIRVVKRSLPNSGGAADAEAAPLII